LNSFQVFCRGNSSTFEGSFNKLQTCFSLFHIDELGSTIFERDDDNESVTVKRHSMYERDDDDEENVAEKRHGDADSSSSESESDYDGIVLNFGRKNAERKKSVRRVRKYSAPNLEPCRFPESVTSFRPISKVPTVATDEEIEAVLESRVSNLDESRDRKSKNETLIAPRKARALRRKLYLDLYKEVSSKMLI
jgi:hypothetical protein